MTTVEINLRLPATERLAKLITAGIVAFGLLLILSTWTTPYDYTDDGENRSGLRPLTDAATGCQYLRAAHGGLIQRFDASGRQRGCRS